MTIDIHARETHEITFSARLVEAVNDDGEYYPEAVVVEGMSFLAASAIVDIAQETINSYFGSYDHPYMAVRPYGWTALTDLERDNYRVSVKKMS